MEQEKKGRVLMSLRLNEDWAHSYEGLKRLANFLIYLFPLLDLIDHPMWIRADFKRDADGDAWLTFFEAPPPEEGEAQEEPPSPVTGVEKAPSERKGGLSTEDVEV